MRKAITAGLRGQAIGLGCVLVGALSGGCSLDADGLAVSRDGARFDGGGAADASSDAAADARVDAATDGGTAGDASTIDSGVPDAGVVGDASTDAMTLADAGSPDAGIDAAMPADAGPGLDAGTDAGTDAGPGGSDAGPCTAGVVCRPSTGPCDPAETCAGGACPADGLAGPGTTCRAGAGACDVAEACTGASATCPTDAFVAAGSLCRGVAGTCDVVETCSGASAACPADTFVAAGSLCRAVAGACDVAETCSGASAACPADAFVATGSLCRASAGSCDVTEACTGGGPACPADGLAAPGTVCRASTGTCDLADACPGATTTCPADAHAPDGSACDDANDCTTSACAGGACAPTPIGNDCDIYGMLVGGFIDVSQSASATLLAAISADNQDDVAQAVTLPFSFPFFGGTYTTIGVSTNGMITLGAGTSTAFANGAIPSAAGPNNAIYAFWDDLTSATSGDVYVDYRGASPNRLAIVQWRRWAVFGDTAARLSFEAVLYEDGVIQLLYGPSTLGAGAMDLHRGASATVGIENATGTVALQFSNNAPNLEAGRIVDFTPDGAGGYTMSSHDNLVGQWIDVRGGTLLAAASNCDDCTQALTLPFVFNFFGGSFGPARAVTTAQVSSNGNVQFAAAGNPAWMNVALPSAAAPTNMVGCFWDDLSTLDTFAPGSEIRVATVGAAPGRVLVVQWVDVPLVAFPGSDVNFELKLFETTNRIECIYGPSIGRTADVLGAGATAGLNNGAGTAGAQASFDAPDLGQGAVVDFIPESNGVTTGYVTRGPNDLFPDISRDAGATSIPGGDDGCTASAIGFGFRYYGTDYTSVSVCDNGLLSFPGATADASPDPLPSAAPPNAIAAPFWTNLRTTASPGVIYTETTGLAPNRVFTAHWQSENESSGSPTAGVDVTFAAQLFETTNEVRFTYGGLLGVTSSTHSGSTSAVGIENQTGLSGVEAGYQSAGTLLSGTQMRFLPR